MSKQSASLIIAGPGAGKTHNMVISVLECLPDLSTNRYLAVITYTNAATENIRKRLEKIITVPENLFIGTIHSFLNKFILLPFGSLSEDKIGLDKMFLQCGIDDVFTSHQNRRAKNERVKTPQDKAVILNRLTKFLNEHGYITFDQTLAVSKNCMSDLNICRIVANRLQYLFIDEFQDSCNHVFSIVENIRKFNKTKIYCVGDPEQYIQSFDSSIKKFGNIPILKASSSSSYKVIFNNDNFRSTPKIVSFLNQFNGRMYGITKFQQAPKAKDKGPVEVGEDVGFITKTGNTKEIIAEFNIQCDKLQIQQSERCILAKKNDLLKRIIASVDNNYMNPKKQNLVLPIKAIQDTLLGSLQMSRSEFFDKYQADIYTLRKFSLDIFKAINNGVITDENTYAKFVTDELKLDIKAGIPVKVANLKFDAASNVSGDVLTISNIHTIKGLESDAVLCIAKTEEELLLWVETNHSVRETKRTDETTDYPRLGYVAFSRARKLLRIACMEKISSDTANKLKGLNVLLL